MNHEALESGSITNEGGDLMIRSVFWFIFVVTEMTVVMLLAVEAM